MPPKTNRQKIKETKIFKESKKIDDPYYLRVLDYQEVELFNAFIFELLIRTDGFKQIYFDIFKYIEINETKSTIEPIFKDKYDEIDQSVIILNILINNELLGKSINEEITSLMKKVNNVYGYSFQTLYYKIKNLYIKNHKFELLMRTDDFKQIYFDIFKYVEINETKSTIEPIFKDKYDEIDRSVIILNRLINNELLGKSINEEKTLLMKKVNNDYGYSFETLYYKIKNLYIKYHKKEKESEKTDKDQKKKENEPENPIYSEKNLLDDKLKEDHKIFGLIKDESTKDMFYDYLLRFDVNIHKQVNLMIENELLKNESIFIEIKVFDNENEQEIELNKIKRYLGKLREDKHQQKSLKNEFIADIKKFIESKDIIEILYHLYCYDLFKNGFSTNALKRKTKEYLKDKKNYNPQLIKIFRERFDKLHNDTIEHYIKTVNSNIENIIHLLKLD